MDAAHAPRQPWRLGERGERWFDRVLATALLLPVLGFLFVDDALTWTLLGLGQLGPLYWRRHYPVAVFAAVALASAAQWLVIDEPLYSQVAFPVATYSVARFSGALPAAIALVVGLCGGVLAAVDWMLGWDEPLELDNVGAYTVYMWALVATAWALGTLGRTRKAYVDALVERGHRIEHEAQQQVALAASAERARIAREMHDVVAHGLTTMVVQADGARYAAPQHPEVAAETLATISETGREALTEMRRLLGVLRDDETGTAPQPRLGDIETLVDEPGVVSELSGLDRPVSDGAALTAYRVVQEALSNVRKHAGPDATPRVRVTVGEDVEIVVEDDGRGASAPDDGRGLGLLGMRERVLAHDGSVEAGPRPSGGYRVRARIPL
jgi:signal transduction histidine kinase